MYKIVPLRYESVVKHPTGPNIHPPADAKRGVAPHFAAPVMRVAPARPSAPARCARERRRVQGAHARAHRPARACEKDDARDVSRVFLFGFAAHEIPRARELVDALPAAIADSGADVGRVDVVGVGASEGAMSARELGGLCASGARADPEGDGTRVLLLDGASARALMPDLKMEMSEEGFEASVFGVFTETTREGELEKAAASVVEAHERYWNLRPTTAADSYDVERDVNFEYEGETD